MKFFFFRSPDAAGSGGDTAATPAGTHTRHLENIPDKDAVLLSVSQTVVAQWAVSPFITLLWQTQPDFAKTVGNFEKDLQSRNTAGGKRSGQTLAVEAADKKIEDALPYMKNMIGGKWGPQNATAYYPQFGIVHRANHWEIPYDREKRKDALRMMAEAVEANGFGDSAYGTTFWQETTADYNKAIADAQSGAGDVSGGVSELVQLRTTLRRVLHAILLLLEANYPDTFEQERRVWGFQKEKY